MTDIELVTAWIAAINDRDRDRFLALSHPEVAFHSPAGIGVGHGVVGEWFDTNPMRIAVKAISPGGDGVIVAHHIDWLGPDGSVEYEIDNAAHIGVRDGKVSSYARVEEGDTP